MSRARSETRPDLYSRLTAQILDQLHRGVRPWTKPWSADHLAHHIRRPRRHDGQPYHGVNVLLLWAEALAKGYTAPTWMTFRQALELGGHVRKGERGTTVVYANRMTRLETLETGEAVEREVGFLKAYVAFNVEQIEDLPPHYHAPAAPAADPQRRDARVEAFFAALGAEIRHGGERASYAIGSDYVQLPPFESFCDPQSYYATLAHECIHWTRHPGRLDRDFGRQRWGDEGYAREELVAELGAAFLCADLGLALTPREDNAAYLASWLKVLQDDTRFIVAAAAHAERACGFLHGLQPPGPPWPG